MIFLLFPLFLVFCYFLWQKWELTKFQVTEYQVSSPKLTFPANVAVIADLHGFSYGKGNERLLRQVRALSPQAILIPGDMLVSKYPATYAAALSTLRGLAEIAPVYYSFGNHESRLRDPETMNHPLFLQYQKAQSDFYFATYLFGKLVDFSFYRVSGIFAYSVDVGDVVHRNGAQIPESFKSVFCERFYSNTSSIAVKFLDGNGIEYSQHFIIRISVCGFLYLVAQCDAKSLRFF